LKELESFEPLGVKVGMRVRVLVGCTVADGVIVGVAEMSGVAVAVAVGVLVGSVEVGNGSRSAFAVPTSAVLVASTSFCEPSPNPCALVLLKMSLYATNTRPTHSRICPRANQRVRFSFKFTVAALLYIWFTEAVKRVAEISSDGLRTRLQHDLASWLNQD